MPRWLRRALVGLLVASTLLLALEAGARLVAGSPLVPVVMRMPDGSQGLFEAVDGVLRPRLEQHRAWWPEGHAATGRARVVFLGGSSLAAAPGDRHKAAALVGEALDVEVVNLAVGGMDTVHLVAELPGVLALSPDLVVIYTGHNDLGNAMFTRRYADPAAVRVARTRRLLRHSRVFELVEQGWREAEERDAVVFFEGHEGSLQPAARAAVLADFEERLDALVSVLTAEGVPVLLSTVVSSAFFPSAGPTCPQALRDLEVPLTLTEAPALDGVDATRLEQRRAAGPCWDLDLIAARLAWDQDRSGAVEALQELRDTDPTPVRGTRASNAAIRRVARRNGAALADAAAAFAERGGGLEPPLWFVDQVHLTDVGDRALAAALAPAAAAALGREDPALPWPEVRPFRGAQCLSPVCRY